MPTAVSTLQPIPPGLRSLIDDALDRARATGVDSITATRRAVQAVLAARPDLTPDEAWALVELAAGPDDRRAA